VRNTRGELVICRKATDVGRRRDGWPAVSRGHSRRQRRRTEQRVPRV